MHPEVKHHLSVVQELEATVEANLKRAFEGKLVAQDPSDEPSGALLERAQREAGNKG